MVVMKAFVMTSVVSQSDILDGLHRLGAAPTSHLMVHASLSAFGHVQGGASDIVAALEAAAGPEGAVVIPSFRDAIRSDYYALRECHDGCPQTLCPSRERGYTGAIGEAVRARPDAMRSCHPTHSWVGICHDARFLLAGHSHSPTPCGADSPFFRLMERDGLIVLLGVGLQSLTNMHSVEDVRNVPYLSAIDPARRHATYTTSGRRIQYRYPDLLYHALQVCGLIRTVEIGTATCHALSARGLAAFLWRVTEDDPWCLVLRPSGANYVPEADAQAKVARMIDVWSNRPDFDAWQSLLAASRKPILPNLFAPGGEPQRDCPAYRGFVREHHRCAANDLAPWEKFSDYPADEPGVTTCQSCNWHPAAVDAADASHS